jgi:hypothetical protein
MYCADCATENDDLATKCSRCGGQSFRATLPGRRPTVTTPAASTQTPIGGWLAFFCGVVGLAAVAPLARGAVLLTDGTVQSFMFALLAVVFSAWALHVVVSLWSHHRAAIRRTRLYMRVGLAVDFVVLGRLYFVADIKWLDAVIGMAVGTVASYLIWSSYFKRSRRVAQTYPGQCWEGW